MSTTQRVVHNRTGISVRQDECRENKLWALSRMSGLETWEHRGARGHNSVRKATMWSGREWTAAPVVSWYRKPGKPLTSLQRQETSPNYGQCRSMACFWIKGEVWRKGRLGHSYDFQTNTSGDTLMISYRNCTSHGSTDCYFPICPLSK